MGLPTDQDYIYSWAGNFSPATGDEPIIEVTTPSSGERSEEILEYQLTVSTLNGDDCPGNATVTLQRAPANYEIPELISPNGDGVNDIFRLFHSGAVSNFQVNIFNRWGQKVFTSIDPEQGWNGTVNGEAQNMGTYLFIMTFELNGVRREEEGQFSLVR